MYDIQSRWKLDGNVLRYYGLRNQPNMFKNTVKLTKKQKTIIENMLEQFSKKNDNLSIAILKAIFSL